MLNNNSNKNKLKSNNDIKKDLNKKQNNYWNSYGNFGSTLLCIIIFLAVCFNVYIVEYEKYQLNLIKIQQEQQTKQLQDKLNKIKEEIAKKNKETADLFSFNDKYTLIRGDFYSKVKEISSKKDIKFDSVEEMIKYTDDRIKLAQDYKAKLNLIAIPPQLANFYNYEMEFIDSDIKLWEIVNAYYNLDDLTKFDINKIYEESQKSHNLFLKSQEELKAVYTKYGLDYFLKDLIFNF